MFGWWVQRSCGGRQCLLDLTYIRKGAETRGRCPGNHTSCLGHVDRHPLGWTTNAVPQGSPRYVQPYSVPCLLTRGKRNCGRSAWIPFSPRKSPSNITFLLRPYHHHQHLDSRRDRHTVPHCLSCVLITSKWLDFNGESHCLSSSSFRHGRLSLHAHWSGD